MKNHNLTIAAQLVVSTSARVLPQFIQKTGSRADGSADSNYPFLTAKERDIETGLDYFLARYYSSVQGRFTSIDPLAASGFAINPQSWNRYSYVLNDPLRLTDPDGEIWVYEFVNKAHTRIRIKWINATQPGPNQFALNFNGQQTVDVVATDGRVVRISQNCDCRQLLRGPQRGGSGGYVNTGLVNELARRTAPMPEAVVAFTLLSLNGGWLFAGSPILMRNAVVFSLYAVGELGKEDEGDTPTMGNVTQYDDSSTRGKSVRNVQTDITKDEFIKTWKLKVLTKEPPVTLQSWRRVIRGTLFTTFHFKGRAVGCQVQGR